MKKRIFTILVVLCLVFSSDGQSAASLRTERVVLKNGLTVLIAPMPSSQVVSVYALVKTGSAREGDYLGAGLSHFMEHMFFKGTLRRGVGQIANEVQSLGGVVNAGTHFDYTIYTLTVPAVHLERAADILSDMMFHPKFDPDEIQKEREVVFNEIRMYHDQPDRYLSKLAFETVYQVHPYRIPIIGFEDLLRPLTRDDFIAYYKRHYTPNNMIVVIAGGVGADEALDTVTKFFGEYPRGPYSLGQVPKEPDQMDERRREEYYKTDLVRLSVIYQGVDVRHQDAPALDALAMILGQGRGSRLYVSLVDEKKIAQTVSASNFTPNDPGVFEIRVSSDQDRAQDIVAEIDRQIDRVIRQGVLRGELEKTVNVSVKSLLMELQSSQEVAYRLALDEALTGKYDFTDWYVSALQQVTSKDIQRVARKYLRANQRSIVVLRPEHVRLSATESVHQKEPAQIEKVVLKNGLTVLLQPETSLPLIWINIVFQAGVHEETSELNGVSQLTSVLWAKGSKRHSYEKLAVLTEQKGISFAGFSGQNSFGLRMNCLSQDQVLCVDLLSDAVLSPAFTAKIFLAEKDRQRAAILRRKDDINSIGSMALREILFEAHPLGMTQLGTLESLEKIRREDVVNFYQRYAVASNAVLSVFGDFNRDEMLALLERQFGSWVGEKPALSDPAVRPITSAIEKTVAAPKAQAAVFFGVQAENFYAESRYALEVLGAIIGSPFNGRMFALIRERDGLSYRLGGGYAPARSAGEIVFQVFTSVEMVDHVRDTIKAIVRDIQERGVEEEELQAVKAYLIGNAQRSWELQESRSFRVALDELYGIGYQDHEQYTSRIQAVSADEIQRLAQKYLNLDRGVFLTVVPEQK